jgi:group II intron reverse transcriptase/maturase
MQTIQTLLNVYQKRGTEKLPLERVYRKLFNRELYLKAYGKIYRNFGAMTRGSTEETVDSMSVQKIDTIIGLLRMERYKWTSVRRTYIEKANGKMRPLGIPTWGDKLLQEVIRTLLEPYYEQLFSNHSHGFRPNLGCHSVLNEIRRFWKGTVWFIEGDIKGCFDNIDHTVLLEIIRRNIHDNRLLNLLNGLLKAGYMEDWKYYDTLSGTPQGGIISPLLSNIYLNELDEFVEDTLVTAYTKGDRRKANLKYAGLQNRRRRALKELDFLEVKELTRQLRYLSSVDTADPDYRRLHYIRYADDFLLGFTGPKKEAEQIRQRIGEFLAHNLKLTLSPEKTLITHAVDDKAKFLGYELKVTRDGNLLNNTGNHGKRASNGYVFPLMSSKVVQKYRERHCRKGKIVHRNELTPETDYTIVQRFQSVYRGLYNYYCMAVNVGRRMQRINRILFVSMVKTLACKYKTKSSEIRKRYMVDTPEGKKFRVVLTRRNKEPLTAEFGGFTMERIPEGMGVVDFDPTIAWHKHASRRSEVVLRLLAGKCELCGKKGPVEVHHIRKLSDIDRPGRRPKTAWEKIMSARKRKTLVVCTGSEGCHWKIHTGRYDGTSL